jgi:hypothetical protein
VLGILALDLLVIACFCLWQAWEDATVARKSKP